MLPATINMNGNKSPRKPLKKKAMMQVHSNIESPSTKKDVKYDVKEFFEKELETYGFTATSCDYCGKHNSEIAGLLMQCGKCKQRHYCSMKCFNLDLPEHQKSCCTSCLEKEPEKKTWEHFQSSPRKTPLVLTVKKIDDNLYKLVVSDPNDKPLRIQAHDAGGHSFSKSLASGSTFRYTRRGSDRPSRTQIQNVPDHGGRVEELFGHGTLKITATNADGLKATAKVSPAEPAAPRLVINCIDPTKHIYKIHISDESGGPVSLKAADSTGHVFESAKNNMATDSLFCYTDAGIAPSEQRQVNDPVHGAIQKMMGHGDLTITATNSAGKHATAMVRPVIASPPRIRMEDLGNGYHRLVVAASTDDPTNSSSNSDDEDDLVTITAVDSKGHSFTTPAGQGKSLLKSGSVLCYTEVGKGPAKQHSVRDHPDYGKDVQKLRGSGTLTLTATNKAGKKASATVRPVEAKAPTVRIESTGPGLYKLHAADESGDPVEISIVDGGGNAFNESTSMELNAVFRYSEAGKRPNNHAVVSDSKHGKVHDIYGQGDLTITVTNKAGKSATASVQPTQVAPPNLELEEVDTNLYRINASDETGDHVTVEAVDGQGNRFGDKFASGDLFSYMQDDERQETSDTTPHGKVRNLRGPAPELWIYCYNQAGKKAKARVKASKQEVVSPKKRNGVDDWENGDYNYELDLNFAPAKRQQCVLTKEVADKLIFWYGRLGHPSKPTMIRKVAHLPACCGITVEDVELLPWCRSGLFLKTTKLHEIISELNLFDS